MTSSRIIIVLCFAAAFSAGLAAGKLWERRATAAHVEPGSEAIAPVPTHPTPVATQTPATVPAVTPPVANPAPPPSQQGQLNWTRDLKLSPQQSEQMRAIWSEAMKNRPSGGNHDIREALRKEREETIKTLLTDDQRKQQETLNRKLERKNSELWNQCRKDQDAQRKQRDEAFKALLSEEQRAKYDAAISAYQVKTEELGKEWRRAFDDAVEKTRAMLTAEQRLKYDELRKSHDNPRRGFGPDAPRPDGPREGPREGARDNQREDGHKPVSNPNDFVRGYVVGSGTHVSARRIQRPTLNKGRNDHG